MFTVAKQVTIALVFFLVLSFTESIRINCNGIINSTQQTNKIDAELLKVKNNIVTLKTLKSDLNAYKKLLKIEKDLSIIKDCITDQKTTDDHANYNLTLQSLWIRYLLLNNETTNLHKNFQNIERNYNVEAAVVAIRNRQYQKVENILELKRNKNFTTNIIVETYANKTENLKVLIDFVKFLPTIDRSLNILIIIQNNLHISDQNDLYQLINLCEAMDSQVFNQTNFSKSKYPSAIKYRKDLLDLLKNYFTEFIESTILSKTFVSNDHVAPLLNQLHQFNATLSYEIIYKVIDKLYEKKNNVEKIIDSMFYQCDIPQREDAFFYVFEKLKSSSKRDIFALKLGNFVFNALKSGFCNRSLDGNQNEYFQNIWNSLPKTVINIFSNKNVCFKNLKTTDYLCLSDDYHNQNPNQRYVVVCKSNQESWFVEHRSGSNVFYLRSKNHINEYIYALSQKDMGEDYTYEYVFGVKSEEHIEKYINPWDFEIIGNRTIIRNSFSKDILCQNSYEFEFREVFAFKDDHKASLENNCQWIVEEC